MAGLPLPCNPKRRPKQKLGVLPPIVCATSRTGCPYGLRPGQCLNGQCPARMHGQIMQGWPERESEAEIQQKQCEEAAEKQRKQDRETFMEEERRLMGMRKEGDDGTTPANPYPSQAFLEFINRKQPVKTMRMPARPLCMLDASDYTAPTGDYAELSRFLRLSTMPGHSRTDHVSEYRGSHSQEVWDGQKDFQRQAFKMKRDWLSVWGEFNVKEQRWRKAWVEKFGAEKN